MFSKNFSACRRLSSSGVFHRITNTPDRMNDFCTKFGPRKNHKKNSMYRLKDTAVHKSTLGFALQEKPQLICEHRDTVVQNLIVKFCTSGKTPAHMRHRDTVVQNLIVKFCTSGKTLAHMRHRDTVVQNITCVCSGICFSTLRTSVVQNVIRKFW